jgi:Carboxypeptidase regulatory-like domain
VAAFISVLMLGAPAQQPDRATISGLVTDSTGAPIADAAVTVSNQATGVQTKVSTSSAGAYATPPLNIGTYSVKTEKGGFAISVQTGILLQGGANYRQDVSLKASAVSETVTVQAQSQLVNPSNPEISNTLNATYYQDLPVVATQDMRLPEALLYAQAGFVPAHNSFIPQTGFMGELAGGQAGSVESYLDGAAFGQGGNTNLTFESSPPIEAIAESSVSYATFSAQTSLTSGGLISYTIKSGTPDLHGSIYEYVNTNQLNAAGETGGIKPSPLHVNSPGFTIGGPVILPKIYNGRKKTFFFVNYDSTYKTDGNLPNFGLTTPIQPFRKGNFSTLLGSKVVGTDVLGRPVYEGEIFNPATSRTVNGVPVRDGYGFDPATGLPTASANMIPANDPLLSKVSEKYAALIPGPAAGRENLISNNYQTPANDSFIHDKTIVVRVDHSFSDWFKMATTVNWDTRPRITNCSYLGGCTGYPAPQNAYIGNGYYQRIRDTLVHQQFDWVIRPTIFNHTTVAYESMDHPNKALNADQNWTGYLGLNGIPYNTAPPPLVHFTGSIPFSQIGNAIYKPNDRPHWYQVLDDVTWIKGKHQVKFGFDFRHFVYSRIGGNDAGGNWNFNDVETGGYDSNGNILTSTGNSFSSFLLGQVDNASFEIDSHPVFLADYVGPWAQDQFTITPRLTLTAGLRWDYQTSMTERNNQMSNFNPKLPNPGAGGIPGAMEFAGTGPGRSGKSSFMDPARDSFGPRVGFAYQVPGRLVNVVRGGYGIYYSSVNMNQFASSPTIGYSTVPTAPNLTNGFSPAFMWDHGFPAANVIVPPEINPAVANGTGPTTLTPDSFNLPRYQNWTLTAERQIGNNMVLDITYLGNKGTRLTNGPAYEGINDNMNHPSVTALGSALLTSDIDSPAAQAAGIHKPYSTFTGDVAQALRPWPQYQNIDYWATPTGSSIYNALEIKFVKRISAGLQAQFSYTLNRTESDGADNGMSHLEPGPGPQNPADPHRGEWARSTNEVPHIIVGTFDYALPFGRGRSFLNEGGFVSSVAGGWRLAGILRYEAGRPLPVTMNNDLSGVLFNSEKRPNRAGDGRGDTSRGMNPATDLYFKSSGWSDPGPLQFGNQPRTDPKIEGFPLYSEDASLIKDFATPGDTTLRFQLQDSNVFNRHTWCDPNANWSSPSFGQVSGQCDLPRRLQLSGKFTF